MHENSYLWNEMSEKTETWNTASICTQLFFKNKKQKLIFFHENTLTLPLMLGHSLPNYLFIVRLYLDVVGFSIQQL